MSKHIGQGYCLLLEMVYANMGGGVACYYDIDEVADDIMCY